MLDKPKDLDLTRFHRWSKPDKNGNCTPTDTKDDAIAEGIIEYSDVFIYNGKLYLYHNGVYQMDDDGSIFKTMISKFIYDDLRTDTRITRIHKLLLSKYSIRIEEPDINNHPPTWVNFRNGMLDIRTLELHPHDPEYRSINQLPHEWSGSFNGADPVVSDFLSGIIPNDDDREMFLQYAGYCFTPDMHLQKFLIISGEGGLGKSVLLRLMQLAVGWKNISCLTLQNLNDRFSPASLLGKLLNIYADLPSTDMGEIAGIKTVVGQDAVRGEYKGGKIFSFHPFCKLLYSANQIPKSRDDKTTAYYRRLLILPITQRGEEIHHLEERLQENIDDFIFLAVGAAHRMYTERDGNILESENSKKAVLDLYMSTDTVKAFMVDTGLARVPDSQIARTDLYRDYCDYCNQEERESAKLTSNGFYSNLREKGFGEKKIGGTRYFVDIGYKPPVEFVPIPDDPPF